MLEGRLADRPAGIAEGVDIAAVRRTPADKFDAELVDRMRRPHEIIFRDTERRVDELELRDGGFTHADRADLIGFDQGDRIKLWRQEACANRCSHPAGRAAADDDDAKGFAHRLILVGRPEKKMAARPGEDAPPSCGG